jgi:hypothetical protein
VTYSGYGSYRANNSTTTVADAGQRTTYGLDAPDAPLVWTLTASARDAEVAASETLLPLIVTRTGKPLRDLSAMAAELAQSGGNAARLLATRVPAGGTSPVSRPRLSA